MSAEGLGPVGGLAADRPVVVTLVLSFGLAALAVAGAQASGAVAGGADLVVYVIAMTALPLALAAIAPRAPLLRVLLVCAVAALLAGLDYAAPRIGLLPPARFAEIAAAVVALLALVLSMSDALGALARFAVFGSLSAVLGMAGAIGLMSIENAGGVSTGALAALFFALGVATALGSVSDYAALFARGAEARRAAGIAARYGAAPAIYAIVIAAAAGFVLAFESGGGADYGDINLAWISGAGALFAAVAGLFATAGALSLRRPSEHIAIEENKRQQAFRRGWRPLRALLPPSSALAFVAIVCVVTIVAAFNLEAALTPVELAFLIFISLMGGVVFLSIRTGAFLLLTLVSGAFLLTWTRQLSGAAIAPSLDFTMALALAAGLYAQLAVAWRDVRSPRLNARETTEAAMADGTATYILSALLGVAAFLAADAAGVWPTGGKAALMFAALSLYGLLIAPAAMTALSHSVRRELA